MLRIMKYLSKAEIGQMLIALVTIVGQVYFDLKLPDYMSDITTLVETPGSHMKDIWIAGGKMLLISLGSAACAIITGYIAARVAASFTQRLRSLEFRKVESFGPAEMSKFSTASLITRSTNDVTQVQMFITMGLQLIVKSPIMAVWAVCKIAGEGFEWTLATGIAVVILLAAIVIMMAMVMPKFKAMQALTDNINLVARENLTGLRVVRAYNAEDYQEAKFTKANKDLTDTQLFTNRVMAFMMPLMNTIMNGLMLAVYWIGAYLIDAAGLKDKLTVFSNMVVFSNYSVQVIMSFLLMSMVFVLWPRADVSAQRIMEVLDTEPIVENGTKTAADVAKTGQRGTVEFRNVSFTYPDSREAMLEGINFTAEQGQTVAFIGSTGSGKSSLINLVPRFYDTSQGQVLVDGVDVRDYDLKALRDKIGYVPQQSVLFKGTVASNVSYGDQPGDPAEVEMADTSTPAGRKREAALIAAGEAVEGADIPAEQLNRVRAAADVAQASEFVHNKPQGLDAPVEAGGKNFSGGQRQRLTIARALVGAPQVLIMDDSASALDFKTDAALRHAIRERSVRGAAEGGLPLTTVIVSQRVSTVRDADMICVLDHGSVAGLGTHDELYASCQLYREICQSQLRREELEGQQGSAVPALAPGPASDLGAPVSVCAKEGC